MFQIHRKLVVCLVTVGLAVVLTACPQKSPEVRVLEARSNYSLEPSGILVVEPEPEVEAEPEDGAVASEAAGAATAMAVAAEAAEAAVAEEAAEGEMLDEEMAAPEGPRSVEIMFDLVVRFNATGEALPGVTVEVVQKDVFEREKQRRLTWVETAGLRKGEERQVPVRLEVDNYEDGDEFSVEFSEIVPPEKRGEYREFTEAAE